MRGGICVLDHGAELEHGKVPNHPNPLPSKALAFRSDPFLDKKDGARRIQLDQDGDEQQQREQKKDHETCQDQVQTSLRVEIEIAFRMLG
jgi:hypothetical protein